MRRKYLVSLSSVVGRATGIATSSVAEALGLRYRSHQQRKCSTRMVLRALLLASGTSLILLLSAPLAVAETQQAVLDPYPLMPADTSSPRDTLHSFNVNTDKALQAWRAGKPIEVVNRFVQRTYETFDFSRLPQGGQFTKKTETVVLMREILDRIEVPPLEDIPGDEALARSEKPITRWTIPKTSITIARIENGPRAGEFLFTSDTVDRVQEFYERVKALPYKKGAAAGFYEDWQNSPGSIVPRSWAAAIPGWAKTVVLGGALWQWLAMVTIAAAAYFLIRLLLRWGKGWDQARAAAGALPRFGLPLSVLASVFALYASWFLLRYAVKIVGDFSTVLSSVFWAMIFIGIGWLVFLVSSRIGDVINDVRQVREGSIDRQLVQTTLRLVSLVIVICVFIYAADFFGVPLTPVLASLGVGGLAIALAVRPTLENVIGGLTLFADKPVRIGDFCRYGDDYGTVEGIGLRSTRLRKLDDTVVSVPNADFSQRELTNFKRIRRRLYRTTLGLRYETTPEQLRYVIARLREMLHGHPKVSPDMLHVRFDGFGAYSLDIEIYAYIRTRDWLNYRAIREDLNFRMMDIVKEAGTGFAFPSQTTYLGRDTGLDAERGREAETRVQEWRSRGNLPFPEFNEEVLSEREDVLDYPPEGSPDYKPRTGVSESSPKPAAEGPTAASEPRRNTLGSGAERR
jgi:MscS family membrane protein